MTDHPDLDRRSLLLDESWLDTDTGDALPAIYRHRLAAAPGAQRIECTRCHLVYDPRWASTCPTCLLALAAQSTTPRCGRSRLDGEPCRRPVHHDGHACAHHTDQATR